LDDNGFVVVSENKLHTNIFFGLIPGNVMHHMEMLGIYRRVRYFDYQGVCFKLKGPPVIKNSNNKASILIVFFKNSLFEIGMKGKYLRRAKMLRDNKTLFG